MKTPNNKSILRVLVWVSAFVIAGVTAVAVSGCGWDNYTDHSARFNGYRSASEFSRLPRLATYSRIKPNKLFSWDEEFGGYEYDEERTQADTERDLYSQANLATCVDGCEGVNFKKAREKYQEYLDRTRGVRQDFFDPDRDVQRKRNTAFDLIDALNALDQGSPIDTIRRYCSARLAYDKAVSPEWIDKELAPCRNDKNLKDNAAYLEAAVFYRTGKSIGTTSFAEVARRYPRSEKRESALFMSAVSHMKAAKTSNDKGSDDAVRDRECELARREFQRTIHEYPKGRFVLDAKGWLAHLWVIVGDRPRALADYYRMLGSDDELWRAEAVVSIGTLRPEMDEAEMTRLETLVADEPRTAIAYAYHEIYNYADAYKWSNYANEKHVDRAKLSRSQEQLKRIVFFATRMMSRYTSGQFGGGFVVRVAEADLELENNADAAQLARRALAMGVTGDLRAEALWVAGAAELKLKQFASAKQALETLVKENRNNRYTEGGWRLLATLREDEGDLEGALDAYLAVDYRYDIAYFTDVLMTADQLKAFINKRPSIQHREEFLYALGVRYLRDRRWAKAREVLSSIKPLARSVDEEFRYKSARYYRGDHPEADPEKIKQIDTHIRGVREQWVDQDLRTANDLERLEREAASAEGDEARAEALYQVASYQFERSLLFYNPVAWHGIRHYLLCDLDHGVGFRQPGESQKLFDYMQRHDMAANALPIFLEVARRFPKTRAARDALYTAAVSHQRLAKYNDYWSTIYSDGGHAGDRMVTFRDVRAAYPGYRFPRGTSGWQPSTRTVNGGPGWDPLPKPKPRPSK